RVTEALICAVYASMLQRFQDERRAIDAVKCFRSEVFPRFHDLYRTSAGLTGYEVDASFLIASAASFDPRPELAQSILAKYDYDSDARSYLESVAELIQQQLPRQADVIAEARAAFAATDIDRAYQLTLELPQSFER